MAALLSGLTSGLGGAGLTTGSAGSFLGSLLGTEAAPDLGGLSKPASNALSTLQPSTQPQGQMPQAQSQQVAQAPQTLAPDNTNQYQQQMPYQQGYNTGQGQLSLVQRLLGNPYGA